MCFIIYDVLLFVFFFFFKQKTAYEMRISDWSSDVCSSDLARPFHDGDRVRPAAKTKSRGASRDDWTASTTVAVKSVGSGVTGSTGLAGTMGWSKSRHSWRASADALFRMADRKSTRLNSSH